MSRVDHNLAVDGEVLAALDAMKRSPVESRNEVLRELLGLPERRKGHDGKRKLHVGAQDLAAEAEQGATLSSLARKYGVTRQAIDYRLRQDPEALRRVRAATDAGREQAAAAVSRAAIERAARNGQKTLTARFGRENGAKEVWADGDLIDIIKLAAEKFGQPLSSLTFKNWLDSKPDLPTYRTVVTRLAPTWAEAAARADVTVPGGRPATVTAQACIDAVRRVAGIVGRPPTYQEYETHHYKSEPSGSSVRFVLKFKGGDTGHSCHSWLNALKVALPEQCGDPREETA